MDHRLTDMNVNVIKRHKKAATERWGNQWNMCLKTRPCNVQVESDDTFMQGGNTARRELNS